MSNDADKDRAIKLMSVRATAEILGDKRTHTALVVARKFSDGNVGFAGHGAPGDLLEALDAQSLAVSAQLLEQAPQESVEFAEALVRIDTILRLGRVPMAVVIARLRLVEANTEGRVKVLSTGSNIGCGDPDCDNCGGDGSLLDKETPTPAAKPKVQRLLH